MGRAAHSSYHASGDIVAPSAIKIPGDSTVRDVNHNSVPLEVPRALETEEVAQVVADFKEGARLAQVAGFDGVEIHGANGYLIDTFLQSSSNQRTDRYGGSVENRLRLLVEVVEAIKEVYPVDRIGVRISPNGVYNGTGSVDNFETFTEVAKAMKEQKLGYIHVMDGLGFGFHGLCPQVTLFDIKKNFEGPVIGNVGYTKDTAEGAIGSGAADMIAFGRPFISNPDLVERFTNNWPLAADAPYPHWYGANPTEEGASVGYTDYEAYKA